MQSVNVDVEDNDGRTAHISIRAPNKALNLEADRVTRRAYREAIRAGRPTVTDAEWLLRYQGDHGSARRSLWDAIEAEKAELAVQSRPIVERQEVALRLREHRKLWLKLLQQEKGAPTTAALSTSWSLASLTERPDGASFRASRSTRGEGTNPLVIAWRRPSPRRSTA